MTPLHFPSTLKLCNTVRPQILQKWQMNSPFIGGNFWNRDSREAQQDIAQWADFETLRRRVQPMPVMTIDLNSISMLRTAITQMKSTTSRGCCGWASDELKMLPDPCLRDLLIIFQKLQNEGFPDWMMQARVVAVAKHHDARSAKSTRPITVLSLLSRLYSKWTSRQILQQWSSTLPAAISGFLPGRSTHKLVYEMQLALEATNHGYDHRHWGGLTLDIIKCFNTLPHQPLVQLLIHFGVPVALVRAWIQSIQQITRYWHIDSQLFPTEIATTGVPEGDAWSVVAMLALNIFMVALMEPLTERLNAYADNWSYASVDPTNHEPAISMLVQISRATSIGIDWGKTWAWGTSQHHKTALTAAKNTHLDEHVPLQLITHARDLGYIMHYRLAPFRGTQKERHKQALNRLTRLRKLDMPIADKAYVAMSSAITKALYGTHMYLVGEEYFSQLRSRIATAMLGDHHNIQSHIACMCLSPSLIDPELWVIQNSLKEARTFLGQATPELSSLFLRMAAHHQVRYNLIVGPAMALSAYIAKLGWTIDQQGHLHTSQFQHLHLIHSNQEELMMATERAWMEHVSLCVSNRHHLRNLPCIDHRATQKLYSKVHPDQQRSLGLDITMGYMLNNQKAHFDENQTDECQFCHMQDSVVHRVLHCPATLVVRNKYPDVCKFLEDHDIIHTLLPVHYLDPEMDFHALLFERFPEPPPISLQYVPQFIFTDGSCKMPADARHRWASYAVVTTPCDITQIPQDKWNDAHWLLQHKFDTLAVSHVTGTQNVSRAELAAATIAQEAEMQVPVVTDSQYVLFSHQVVENTQHVWKLHKKRNFDLLKRLHHLYWTKRLDIPVLKVKAHQRVLDTDAHPMHKIGNLVADLAATQTQDELSSQVTRDIKRLAAENKEMQILLQDHFSMRTELAELRKRMESEAVNLDEQAPPDNFFRTYSVENPVRFVFADEQLEHVHASRFGSHYSALVLQWLQMLDWPSRPDRNKPPIGITWFELACNFMLTTQHSLMINTAISGQPARYRCIEEDETLDPHSHCFSLATNAFRDCIAHLQFLLQVDLLPTLTSTKVTSLRKMGGKASKQGICYRPQLPCQEQTIQLLVDYFKEQDGSKNFSRWPIIPDVEPCVRSNLFPPPGDTQAARNSRYNLRRKIIRQSRQPEG